MFILFNYFYLYILYTNVWPASKDEIMMAIAQTSGNKHWPVNINFVKIMIQVKIVINNFPYTAVNM